MVVAIGDSTLVFVMPTLITYIYDYISDKTQQNLETTLRFIATQQGRIPFIKYITEDNIQNTNLSIRESKKLRKRLKEDTDIEVQKKSAKQFHKEKYNSIQEIQNLNLKEYVEYNTISRNIDNLDLNDVRKYILFKLDNVKKSNQTMKSELRKLILIYDLKKNYNKK